MLNNAVPISPTPAAAVEYVKAGLVLVPYDRSNKGPRHKKWNLRENCMATVDQASNLYGNIGVAHLYSGTCAVDIDDMVRAVKWFHTYGIDIKKYLNAPDAVRISSGREGRAKLIFGLPPGVGALPTKMNNSDGVELRCATLQGRTVQDVLPPSIHPDTGNQYRWEGDWRHLPILPDEILTFWRGLCTPRELAAANGQTLPHDSTEAGPPLPSDVSDDEIDGVLDRINAAKLSRKDWLRVGMGLHYQTQGSQEGLDKWDTWSRRDAARYREEDWPSTWESFHLDHENPVTLRSLERLAVPVDMTPEYEPIPDEPPPPAKPLRILEIDGRITDAEWEAAPKPPQEIVHHLLLQDASGFVAPGGTGKTTIAINEYIHIILDRPLWGRRIVKPGPVAFLTAEDSRQIVIDRTKWCMDAMKLTPAERLLVRENFHIDDVAMSGAKLVQAFENGWLKPTILRDELIAKYRNRGLSVLHLDPASLLGPGEVHGNDGATAMNRAMRHIATEVRCCVQLIHHVAQAVARGGIMDQYAGRGGTAFADNSRGQRQMLRLKSRDLTFDGTKYQVPIEAISDEDIRRGRLLAILVHKLSYVEVDPTPIFIARHGYGFSQLPFTANGNAAEEKTVNQAMEIIAGFILKEAANDRRHTRESISGPHRKELGAKISRQDVRDLIDEGLRIGRFVTAGLPEAECQGGKTTFLVVADLDHIDQEGV